MNIKKEELKELIENAFYSGMNCGYGVDHENIHEDEDNCWKKYSESLDVFKTVIPKCSECQYCKQIGKKIVLIEVLEEKYTIAKIHIIQSKQIALAFQLCMILLAMELILLIVH